MSNELVKADQYVSEIDYARKVGEMIVASGKWSKDYNKDTVALLVMYAKEIGINPVKALMCGFDIIQGRITMKPMMMNDMIRKAGHSLKFEQNDEQGCIITGKRKDTGDTCTVRFTLDDAKKAGLLGKDNYSKWTSNMLYARCMGNLARMLFADVIGGVYMEGEIEPPQQAQKHSESREHQAINVDAVDMETGEMTAYTIADLHESVGIGSLDDVSEFVRYIAIAKKCAETDVINGIMESDEIKANFKAKLQLRIEKPAVQSIAVETQDAAE